MVINPNDYLDSLLLSKYYQSLLLKEVFLVVDRVLGHFCKPEATRTRRFRDFTNPNLPEPELLRIQQNPMCPNPKFKPAGTRRVLKPSKSLKINQKTQRNLLFWHYLSHMDVHVFLVNEILAQVMMFFEVIK